MPFEEQSHTADVCLRIWAADLNQLFVDAALGMNALAGISLAGKPCVRRSFTYTTADPESLLVSFLSDLVYYIDHVRIAFDHFNLRLDLDDEFHCRLVAELQGAPILSIKRNIKAVTFHNLQIQHSTQGYELEIVFDV
jgi:SHS2 domain-containing protein